MTYKENNEHSVQKFKPEDIIASAYSIIGKESKTYLATQLVMCRNTLTASLEHRRQFTYFEKKKIVKIFNELFYNKKEN